MTVGSNAWKLRLDRYKNPDNRRAVLELVGGLGYAVGDGLLAWSLASVVSGAGAALLWNATEALLAREAPSDARGRVMGLYQTALGAALALGRSLSFLAEQLF